MRKAVQWGPESYLDDPRMATDLDHAGNRSTILDFRHSHVEQLGCALLAVIGGRVEVRPGSDDGDRS